MKRIVVVGSSGVGKSTLAREIARRKDVPYVELDALQWQANWTAATTDELRAGVTEASTPSPWVIDGNYLKVREASWTQADTIVWLDYAFAIVFTRALKRTLLRVIRNEELWNGNRETWKSTFSRDSILKWVVITHRKCRHTIPEALAHPEYAHLEIVHLRSPRQTRNWLQLIENEAPMGLRDELKEYYTVQELAALVKVTEATVEKLAHCGEIAHEVVGAVIRIPRHEVEKLLGKRRRVKWRRAGLAALGVLAALAGAGAAYQKRKNSDKE